jgi:uncharacterized protein with PIN domain
MRFLCDEMLARLARLLRAAGYDTDLSVGGERDSEILARARDEARVLVTRDRRLADKAGPGAVLLADETAAAQAQALSRMLPIDWGFAPFTRCVIDNAPLREATAEEVARMPVDSRERPGPFRACPACGRLYWPGSHVRRMAARLADLARDSPQA